MAAAERHDINVLRGFAAAYMVIHHVWARFPKVPLSQLGEAFVFVGSCAPVVFFFVTGMGYGAQGARKGPLTAAAWKKILVLLMADRFLFLGSDRSGGILDFLGFIALSALLLEGIVRTARPMLVAAGISAVAMVVRYGLGSSGVPEKLGMADSEWFNVLVGAQAVEGLGYPVFPWVVYPCLGFIAARLPRPSPGVLIAVLVALAVPSTLAAMYLVRGGRGVFRWGTVSLSFVLLSVTVLAVSAALTLLIERSPRLVALTSIRGIASLAVVPIHYLCIELAASVGLAPTVGIELAGLTALIMVVTFAASQLSRTAIERSAQQRPAVMAALAIVSVLGAAVALIAGSFGPLVGVTIMVAGQLGLSIALAVRLGAAFQLGGGPVTAQQTPKV